MGRKQKHKEVPQRETNPSGCERISAGGSFGKTPVVSPTPAEVVAFVGIVGLFCSAVTQQITPQISPIALVC